MMTENRYRDVQLQTSEERLSILANWLMNYIRIEDKKDHLKNDDFRKISRHRNISSIALSTSLFTFLCFSQILSSDYSYIDATMLWINIIIASAVGMISYKMNKPHSTTSYFAHQRDACRKQILDFCKQTGIELDYPATNVTGFFGQYSLEDFAIYGWDCTSNGVDPISDIFNKSNLVMMNLGDSFHDVIYENYSRRNLEIEQPLDELEPDITDIEQVKISQYICYGKEGHTLVTITATEDTVTEREVRASLNVIKNLREQYLNDKDLDGSDVPFKNNQDVRIIFFSRLGFSDEALQIATQNDMETMDLLDLIDMHQEDYIHQIKNSQIDTISINKNTTERPSS
ncbi:hypothetical protein OAM26_05530 [Porticoccaceae bacterium]|nr:hypothetical protein [Porticoccaceae bacterium]